MIQQTISSYSDKKIIPVVCSSDDKYAMPLAVTIRSVLENLNNNCGINLFVVDGGISSENKKKILDSLDTKSCTVKFISKPTEFPRKFKASDINTVQSYITVTAYYRLLLSEILPTSLNKIIYLDCDLVLRTNLESLWDEEINDNYVLAVRDMWAGRDAKHFNSGVLVINLEKWRTDNIGTKALQFLKEHNYSYFDQEVLNILFLDQWKELDPRWNVLRGILDSSSWEITPFTEDVYQKIISSPYIIHYASSAKPWNAPASKVPWSEDFFKYLDMTAWSGWRFTFWRRLKKRLMRDFTNVFKSLGKRVLKK